MTRRVGNTPRWAEDTELPGFVRSGCHGDGEHFPYFSHLFYALPSFHFYIYYVIFNP